jgi:hypothetical protein
MGFRKEWNVKSPGLAVACVVHGLTRAQVVKSYLESYGIPVALDYESAGPIIGITVDGLGEVRVLVPNRRLRRAKRLLMHSHRPVPYRRRFRRRLIARWRRRHRG